MDQKIFPGSFFDPIAAKSGKTDNIFLKGLRGKSAVGSLIREKSGVPDSFLREIPLKQPGEQCIEVA